VLTVLFKKGQGAVADVLNISKDIKVLNHKLNEYNNIYKNTLSYLKSLTNLSKIEPKSLLSINNIRTSIDKC